MITGVLDPLRQGRRPLIAAAVGLVLLQTLVAGLARAQSAALLAPLLAASPLEAGAICQGAGGEPPAGGAPGSGASRDACCAFCAAGAPMLGSVTPPLVGYVDQAGTNRLPLGAHDLVLMARRAVRAGPSQAPPSFA